MTKILKPSAPVPAIISCLCLRQPKKSAIKLVGNTAHNISWWNNKSSAKDEEVIIGAIVTKTGVNKQCIRHTPDRRIANLSKLIELSIWFRRDVWLVM